MKLFIYDEKHEMDLGCISEEELTLLENIAIFLEENNITNRYKRLVLGNKYRRVYDELNEFSEIKFS
jgi:hypothetical protein